MLSRDKISWQQDKWVQQRLEGNLTMTLKRNPDATCATCPYSRDCGGDELFVNKGLTQVCLRFPLQSVSLKDLTVWAHPQAREPCGEHPEFFLPQELSHE